MFMLTALLQVLVAIAIAVLSILGYQYVAEGYGLHPLLCAVAVFIMVIMMIWFHSIPYSIRARV
jgi:uncharacterized membrane protein